jgi:hypothetical protein
MSNLRFLEASAATASREHLRAPHDATRPDDLDFRNATKADTE